MAATRSPEEIRRSIEANRADLGVAVEKLRGEVTKATDWHGQLRAHKREVVIGAVIVGVVTVFADFPTATIVWAIYSIIYQQVENTLIQPQIQKRAVNVHPFIVLVAVLFGSTLLGVLGALVAIPVAASVQIAIREWWDYRHDRTMNEIIAPAAPKSPPDLPAPPSAA